MTPLAVTTISEQPGGAGVVGLEQAFRHFSETSARLEAKYEQLQQETENLREQLREKDAEIKRAERLATLGKTAAAIAHEVRNPLGAMKLFVSLLRQDMAGRPASLEMLGQVEQSIKNIENVVSNILQFAKEQKPQFVPINLHAIIQEQLALLRPAVPPGVTVETGLAANPFIYGDEYGLRRVFYNLFLNAVQALRNGSGRLSISTADRGQQVEVCVQDTGPGVPADLLDAIFDPFITTKKEGMGLGLAVVKRVIGQHDGTIVVRNDGGAQFLLQLPRCQPQRESSKDSQLRGM